MSQGGAAHCSALTARLGPSPDDQYDMSTRGAAPVKRMPVEERRGSDAWQVAP